MDDLSAPVASQPSGTQPGDNAEAPSVGRLLTLKEGEIFVVADAQGDIGQGADGLFIDDMRVISHLRLLVGERRPAALSYGVSKDNAVFTAHGTNTALPPMGGRATPRGVVHIERKRVLSGGRLYERIRASNFSLEQVMLPLAVEYAADFVDMFEVRGTKRVRHGKLETPVAHGRQVSFAYEGLDGVKRTSVIAFSEPPWRFTDRRADFMLHLPSGACQDLFMEIGATVDEEPSAHRFALRAHETRHALRERMGRGANIRCPDSTFEAWLEQSRADMALLTTDLPTGPYPFAGIPWFSTPFGRDGIISAWQMLWLDPSLAKGVLTYLAARQAHETDPFRDSAPGKIMHETRAGEMAALREVPFGLYYGGVDTTPLFVALAGAYWRRTGDLDLIRSLWPALTAAIGWLETHGDSNGDGLIDYARGADTGLSNQGWKDSEDSVFHADGRFPASPIALVEVQGYAFAAYKAMADMGKALGHGPCEPWRDAAETLRQRVEERFWMEEEGFYGIAVDGTGALCRTLASNAGHLLFVGLPSPERAKRVTERLLSGQFDTGWGLRTLGKDQARHNPMSYHNGSVWPHDTAICVSGMAQYGERIGVKAVIDTLFDAAKSFDLRLPELFCGFEREHGEPPIAYPVACMPQAWAAGSAFMLLQAGLGCEIDAIERQVRLWKPELPHDLHSLRIENLTVGDSKIDLVFHRTDGQVRCRVEGCDGTLSVVELKR